MPPSRRMLPSCDAKAAVRSFAASRERRPCARQQEPASWAGTVLGQALVNAAEAIQDDEVNEQQHTTGLRRIVLVSDIQQGSRLETLRTYEWPEGTELVVKPIVAEGTTNATLQLLRTRDDLAVADSQIVASSQ